MLLPAIWAPSSLPNTSVKDASALHLGSILAAKYLSPGCFCPPSRLHPHCQIHQFRMLLPSIWAPSSLPKTSVQDASALHLGSILTANTSVQDASVLTSGLHPHCQIHQFRILLPSILTANLSSGCFCPPSGLHPHCQIPQFRMLLSSFLCSILAAKYLSSGCFCPHFWTPSLLQELLTTNLSLVCII